MNDSRDIGAYYEQRYSEDEAGAFPRDRARYRAWLCELLDRDGSGSSVLDFGCGVGFVCSEFLDRGYAATGVDISSAAIEAAAVREPRGSFLHLPPAQPLPFPDATFDVLTCLGVIEHVPEPGPTIAELRRVARPGASGIWVVPNAWSPFFWLGHGTEQIEETPRSLGAWSRLLAEGGWQIEAVRRDPGPLDRRVATWKRIAQRVLNSLPLRLTYQFVLVTRPLPYSGPGDEGQQATP